jgi:hypothetical protein
MVWKPLFDTKSRRLAATFCLLLAIMVVCWVKFRPPDFQVTFLSTTNSGLQGVFQMHNGLAEPVVCAGGFFKKAAEKSMDPAKGDFGAAVQLKIPAKTTSTFTTWIPTNGGPYRLVVDATPARKLSPPYYATFAARVSNWIMSLIRPGGSIAWRLAGWSLVASEPFEPK